LGRPTLFLKGVVGELSNGTMRPTLHDIPSEHVAASVGATVRERLRWWLYPKEHTCAECRKVTLYHDFALQETVCQACGACAPFENLPSLHVLWNRDIEGEEIFFG